MFSHESLPLIAIFIIMLLCVIAAFLHPVHAFFSWLRRRKERSNARTAEDVDSR
ncbi:MULTISPECIES: hypothetical protein [Pseudomonas]|uniref:Uncharacterized protein n=1 Tax=Pseudomonas koreensis TaxID=198620 RepID=A0AA94JJW6_9PSED|nr:hypothetical protein [Pseudomonas koreensis]RVD80041.1 hypothetical protein A9HBioS_0565 [Pseudomonas koreensis]